MLGFFFYYIIEFHNWHTQSHVIMVRGGGRQGGGIRSARLNCREHPKYPILEIVIILIINYYYQLLCYLLKRVQIV